MKIALIGYGKMGQEIEKEAARKGHQIVARISSSNKDQLSDLQQDQVDVAIEFTSPHAAADNIAVLLDKGIKVVSGSTGWLDRYEEMVNRCKEAKTAFLYASNFSVGVNITFAINRQLARLMNQHSIYQASILEIHHTSKQDAPSGTAITLAEGIVSNNDHYDGWVKGDTSEKNIIPISSERVDPAPGTHVISHKSDIDTIEISHTAHSRSGFAQGAVLAAEYINHRIGIFTMQDVLNIT